MRDKGKHNELLERLQFDDQWVRLGVLSDVRLGEIAGEFSKGEDSHAEHYRWRAFRSFLDESPELDGNVLKGLYELGEKDPDSAMGGSMMAEVLRRRECPSDLLEAALLSNRSHLVKIARAKLEVKG